MAVIGGTEIVASFRIGSSGGVSSINGLTGAVTLAAGTNVTIVPTGNTLTFNAFGTIGGSIAVNQVAVGSGANTINGFADFTWVNSTQTLSIGDGSKEFIMAGPVAVGGGQGILLASALFNSAVSLSATTGISLSIPTGETIILSGPAGQDTWSYSGTTGYTSWIGGTSGSAAIGVALVAGTPNPILLPTATGAAGTFLQTNGGSPQQTSWVALTGATVIASGTIVMPVTALPANTTSAVATATAAGVLATDAIEWSFNGAPSTGYTEGIFIDSYPTAGNVNFVEVNPTAGARTPGAATLNWRVIR